VIHRIEQRIDHQIAKAHRVEVSDRLVGQVEQLGGDIVRGEPTGIGQGRLQMVAGRLPTGAGRESQRAGGANPLAPIIGHIQSRILGHRENLTRIGALVVVGGGDARRSRAIQQQRRVPKHQIPVQPRGHLLGVEVNLAVRRQTVRANQQ
jgi:hypothetical protein